jgi:NitT/TauT family transport system substrate-binding protein
MPTHRQVRRTRPSLLAAVLVTLLALIAASCGGEDDSGAPPGGGGGPVKLKVGILPIADVAPIWYGMSKGFFAAENLEIETVPGQGGAALVPSVMSGEYQFAFGNVVTLMLARQQGVPVKVVSNLVNGAERADRGTNALLVAPGKGINSVRDLAGKKFAVTTLRNAGEVTIKATLRKAGADISNVQFAEFPFPNMNAMVQQGQVDVAWQAEPFITLGKDAGLQVITDPMFDTMPDLTIASMFASEEYIASNGDVVERFKRAMARSIDAAKADEPGIRETIGKNTQIPAPVVPRIALANWDAEVNRASIDRQSSLAKEFGILEEDVSADDLLWSP